ncbi:NADPH-dependent F420 reductase [Lysobacter sp. CA199]|uniref:NADPH-dependent F420 reductase n=1 Tax=Lysobacter sp. CA199 TaxID=3455608 RepID=UPI003F8D57D3
MSIGILGAGHIGSAIARTLARAGIPAQIANRRRPQSLAGLVAELGPNISAATAEQVAQADLVFVAINWSKLPQALAGLDWRGRIVVDANNPIEAPQFKPFDLHGRTSSEVFADLVPGARVVKAMNHLLAEVLGDDPRGNGGQRVLFLSGDDAAAKAEVAALLERTGYFAIDLGGLAEGGRAHQFPGGPLAIHHLVKQA